MGCNYFSLKALDIITSPCANHSWSMDLEMTSVLKGSRIVLDIKINMVSISVGYFLFYLRMQFQSHPYYPLIWLMDLAAQFKNAQYSVVSWLRYGVDLIISQIFRRRKCRTGYRVYVILFLILCVILVRVFQNQAWPPQSFAWMKYQKIFVQSFKQIILF